MVQIKIHSSNLNINSEITEKIIKAVNMATDRFVSSIQRIEVSFADINGPRGGVDKRCRVIANLVSSGSVVAESDSPSMLSAIHEACNKLKRGFSKRISRRKEKVRALRQSDLLL